MISKVFDGHSFYHACRYVCNKMEATVISTEGVREYSYQAMAQDFLGQAAQRESNHHACFHAVLSFHPDEKPTDEKLVTLAKEYLAGLGITNTQFAVVKHNDKAHLHLHVLANMVNNEGQSIKNNYIGLRGKKVAQQLTLKHQLIQSEKKDLKLTNLDSLSQSENSRYNIYMVVMATLPQCRTMEDLETRLKAYNIEILYKYKGQTQERQGVSFRLGTEVFKGSKIDRKLSLGSLEKILAAQQHQGLKTDQIQSPTSLKLSPRQIGDTDKLTHTTDDMVTKAIESLALIEQALYNANRGSDYVPYELLGEPKKKFHKRRR